MSRWDHMDHRLLLLLVFAAGVGVGIVVAGGEPTVRSIEVAFKEQRITSGPPLRGDPIAVPPPKREETASADTSDSQDAGRAPPPAPAKEGPGFRLDRTLAGLEVESALVLAWDEIEDPDPELPELVLVAARFMASKDRDLLLRKIAVLPTGRPELEMWARAVAAELAGNTSYLSRWCDDAIDTIQRGGYAGSILRLAGAFPTSQTELVVLEAAASSDIRTRTQGTLALASFESEVSRRALERAKGDSEAAVRDAATRPRALR